MVTTSAPDDVPAPQRPGPPEPPQLTAWIEPHTDGKEWYTVAPHDATGIDLMSRWLTAPIEIVCDLTEMR